MTTQPTSNVSEFDDHRRPLQRAIRFGSLALLTVSVVSLSIWGWAAGIAGIWGVLMGAAIGGGFVLLTAISVLVTANTTPSTTGAVVLGSWLLKIVVLLGVLMVIRGMTFYDRWAFVVTTTLVLIAVLSVEVWSVITSRVTYVQPSTESSARFSARTNGDTDS